MVRKNGQKQLTAYYIKGNGSTKDKLKGEPIKNIELGGFYKNNTDKVSFKYVLQICKYCM